jgi:hypothetical protein
VNDEERAESTLERDLRVERERSATFEESLRQCRKANVSIGDRIESVERQLIARRTEVSELRRAIVDVLTEVANGSAFIRGDVRSPACERAQDAYERYGVTKPAAMEPRHG